MTNLKIKNMTKLIKVTKQGKTYIVKLERVIVNNMLGINVMVFCDNENSECVMRHFLDFSKHPADEIDKNIIKFSDHFDEKIALEWVEGYLDGKR